jgi:hypothetical protein
MKIMIRSLEAKKVKYVEHHTVYYPYLLFEAMVHTRIFSKFFHSKLCCLIDLINGREAIAEPLECIDEIEVDEHDVLSEQIPQDDLPHRASAYINYVLYHNLKVLQIPKIEIVNTMVIYRPYLVIEGLSGNERISIMMDGISGQYQILNI